MRENESKNNIQRHVNQLERRGGESNTAVRAAAGSAAAAAGARGGRAGVPASMRAAVTRCLAEGCSPPGTGVVGSEGGISKHTKTLGAETGVRSGNGSQCLLRQLFMLCELMAYRRSVR